MPTRYTVDVDGLRALAQRGAAEADHHRRQPQPVPASDAEIRGIADEVGALVLFDAAHLSRDDRRRGWQQPLDEGAHLMTMSTYKSLGGPPSGLIVTNDAALAERLDAIAYPGLTANFDAAKSAALAITLLDWKRIGARLCAEDARDREGVGASLAERGLPVLRARHAASPRRTSSRSRRRGSAAARRRRSGCARPTSWPAASACRSGEWQAT